MIYREQPKCEKCNKPIEGIYRAVSDPIVYGEDTFVGWDYSGHICHPLDDDRSPTIGSTSPSINLNLSGTALHLNQYLIDKKILNTIIHDNRIEIIFEERKTSLYWGGCGETKRIYKKVFYIDQTKSIEEIEAVIHPAQEEWYDFEEKR